MLQPVEVEPVHEQGQIEQRSRGHFARIDTGLRDVQAADPRPDHGLRRFDADRCATLGVVVGQFAVERGDHVVEPEQDVAPLIGHRIFEIEHHARRTGVEHLDDQFGVVGGPGHLIALVSAPSRQRDLPIRRRRLRGREIVRKLALVRARQDGLSLRDVLLLPSGEAVVQRPIEGGESGRKVARDIETRRRDVHRRQQVRRRQGIEAEAQRAVPLRHPGPVSGRPVLRWDSPL